MSVYTISFGKNTESKLKAIPEFDSPGQMALLALPATPEVAGNVIPTRAGRPQGVL